MDFNPLEVHIGFPVDPINTSSPIVIKNRVILSSGDDLDMGLINSLFFTAMGGVGIVGNFFHDVWGNNIFIILTNPSLQTIGPHTFCQYLIRNSPAFVINPDTYAEFPLHFRYLQDHASSLLWFLHVENTREVGLLDASPRYVVSCFVDYIDLFYQSSGINYNFGLSLIQNQAIWPLHLQGDYYLEVLHKINTRFYHSLIHNLNN